MRRTDWRVRIAVRSDHGGAVKPKECYDDTAGRARRLVRLHDGLINRRAYRIRADWALSFKRLMHWPMASRIERVDSADAVIVLRDGAGLAPDDFSADALEDLLRAAVTFGVSALDRYIHERVVKGFVAAFSQPLNRRQEEFSIPASVALDITRQVARARNGGTVTRPANEVRKAVQELLHKQPFQIWKELEYAFALLGIKNVSGQLQAAYGVGDIKPIRRKLNEIVRKRNLIVHEGDLVRHKRAGQVRKNDITRAEAAAALDFLDDLVEKLEAVN
jgi:hypothetical protein